MDKYEDIYEILNNIFPGSKCFLDHKNTFELLCAVMMSAQTTDERVNKVTPLLFAKYDTPYKLANASLDDVVNIIRPIGLANNKGKNLIKLSKCLVEQFNGVVPSSREELMMLPGVGRKTANVVMAVGFNIPTIAVDTHVSRVSYRLGFRDEADNELVCEQKLMKLFPKEHWISIHHLLILFGRNYCEAKKPLCDECPLKKYCVNGK